MLVASSPVGPAEPVPEVAQWPDDQGGEEVADLVAGQRDLAVGRRAAGVLGGGGDGQERGGEHGQGDPAVPGVPAADLMLVQAGQAPVSYTHLTLPTILLV